MRALRELILARQENHIVREVELDFIEGEVGVLDVLGVDDDVVAVVANDGRGVIGANAFTRNGYANGAVKVWAGLWVEVFGTTPGNLLK